MMSSSTSKDPMRSGFGSSAKSESAGELCDFLNQRRQRAIRRSPDTATIMAPNNQSQLADASTTTANFCGKIKDPLDAGAAVVDSRRDAPGCCPGRDSDLLLVTLSKEPTRPWFLVRVPLPWKLTLLALLLPSPTLPIVKFLILSVALTLVPKVRLLTFPALLLLLLLTLSIVKFLILSTSLTLVSLLVVPLFQLVVWLLRLFKLVQLFK